MAIGILLIEDNADHALMTKRIVEQSNAGYQLDCVNDVAGGLNRIMHWEYRLVLCDYRLAGATALEVLQQIRQSGKDIPFVVVTSAGDQRIAVDLMKEGAYDYIVKDDSYGDVLPAVISRSFDRYAVKKEKERLEEEIIQQKIFLETIINSLNHPFFVIDLDHIIVLRNNATEREKTGNDGLCYRFIHARDTPCADAYPCLLEEVLRTGKAVQVEWVKRSNNANVYMEVHGDPIFDKNGKIIQIIEYFIDVTQRKKAEEELLVAYDKLQKTQLELIQSSKMAAVGQLAAGISHELSQPLTGIRGFAQTILLDLDKETVIREDLERIIRQVDRMDTIIKNVRFFSRKSEFAISELDINKPVEDALMLLTEQLKVHNVRLVIELEKNLPKIKGDCNQLQQVFLNLIANARDAMDSLKDQREATLFIKTSFARAMNVVVVNVRDTGCGISENVLEHIFNPFFTTKPPGKGTGLGLSIVYRIVESHGGKVSVESREGVGTCFTAVFPIVGTFLPEGTEKGEVGI